MRVFAGLTGVALIVAACGSSDTAATTTAAADIEPTAATKPDPTPEDLTTADPDPTPPDDLQLGTVDTRTIVMSDGTEIVYGLVLPQDFDPSEEYPVLLALPPGGQDGGLTISLAESTYAPEALARGWVVLTPAAPNGTLFFQGSEQYLGEFLDAHSWIRPEGGRYHLAGISNGGISAFRIAALQPTTFSSIVVFPGFPREESDRAALAELTDIPIAMFVGGEDTGWIEPMSTARDSLDELGGTVSLDIREGEGHVMSSLANGVDVFDFLDSARG